MQAVSRSRSPLRAETRELGDARVVVVPPFAAGDRLDGFLQRHGGEPDRSRSEWQRLIGADGVLVNGLPARPSHRVATGDQVTIAFVARPAVLSPEDSIDFEVVYDDP